MHTDFHGIYPMLYTFYDATGALDRAAFVRQVDACIESGVHGIALLGIVGEYNKLDVREKMQIVEWAMEAVRGRVPVAVTVSEPSERGQVEFARAVQRLRPRVADPAAAGDPQRARARVRAPVRRRRGGGRPAHRDPEQSGEPRRGAVRRGAARPPPQPPQRVPAEGRGTDPVRAAPARGHAGRVPHLQRPRRARTAGQRARRLRGPHPGAGSRGPPRPLLGPARVRATRRRRHKANACTRTCCRCSPT